MTDFTANWLFGSERTSSRDDLKSSYGGAAATRSASAGVVRDVAGFTRALDLGLGLGLGGAAYDDIASAGGAGGAGGVGGGGISVGGRGASSYDSVGAASIMRNGLYQSGLTAAELVSLSSAASGLGVLGATGLAGVLDDPTLAAARLAGYDLGLSGRLGLPQDDLLRSDLLPPEASATLFVDGLPVDCSRREAAHIFRPFIGFKEVRVVHKDAKRAVGEKIVLCFVEFADPRCAATALEALQGYKFDENDPDSYVLRLTFARYPGPRGAGARDRSPFRGRDRSPRRDRRQQQQQQQQQH